MRNGGKVAGWNWYGSGMIPKRIDDPNLSAFMLPVFPGCQRFYSSALRTTENSLSWNRRPSRTSKPVPRRNVCSPLHHPAALNFKGHAKQSAVPRGPRWLCRTRHHRNVRNNIHVFQGISRYVRVWRRKYGLSGVLEVDRLNRNTGCWCIRPQWRKMINNLALGMYEQNTGTRDAGVNYCCAWFTRWNMDARLFFPFFHIKYRWMQIDSSFWFRGIFN